MGKDLHQILVPEFAGNPEELSSLISGPKPLVVLLVRSPTEYSSSLLSAFEYVAREFNGRIIIHWINIFEAGGFRRLFPGKNPTSIVVFCGGQEFGDFSCGESGPGVPMCVDDALMQNRRLQSISA